MPQFKGAKWRNEPEFYFPLCLSTSYNLHLLLSSENQTYSSLYRTEHQSHFTSPSHWTFSLFMWNKMKYTILIIKTVGGKCSVDALVNYSSNCFIQKMHLYSNSQLYKDRDFRFRLIACLFYLILIYFIPAYLTVIHEMTMGKVNTVVSMKPSSLNQSSRPRSPARLSWGLALTPPVFCYARNVRQSS